MSIGSIVEMYCATAKHSTFVKIGSAARLVKRLVMTCPVTTYSRDNESSPWKSTTVTKTLTSDCDAVADDGAWYLTAQLAHAAELLLVLPDESVDFNGWRTNGTTFDAALTAIETYNNNTGINGWDGLTQWFDEQLGNFGAYLTALDVEMIDQNGTRYGKKSVPAYNNPNASLSVWLAWVHSSVSTNAGNSTMDNWYDATTNSYIVTVVLSYQSFSMTIHLKLAI